MSTFPVNVSLVGIATSSSVPTPTLREMGPCTCNILPMFCDAGCGCDPDCSTEQVALFSSFLPDGPVVANLTSCVDPDLVRVNKRGDLTANLLGNLMCVTRDNYPTQGRFLDTPDTFTEAQLNDVRTNFGAFSFAPTDSSTTTTTTSTSTTTTTTASAYTSNARIPRALRTADGSGGYTITPAVPAFLPLPTGDLQGACSPLSPAGFMSEAPSRACQRASLTPATACSATGVFAPAVALSGLALARTPGAVHSDAASWAPIVIASVFTVTASTNTFTQVYDISTVVTAGQTLEEVTPYTFAAPVWDAANCRCDGALLAATYSVSYTAAGAISSVNVTAVTGPATGTVSATTSGGCALPFNYAQSWGLVSPLAGSFQATAGVAQLPTGLVVVPARSGVPGYLAGSAVLAGVVVDVTDPTAADPTAVVGQAVARAVGGLTTISFNSDRQCVATAATPSLLAFTAPVSVGVDTAAQCTVPLTLAALETLCTDADGLRAYMEPTQTRVGVWGNASAENLYDWRELQTAAWPSATPGTWDPLTATCSNLVTSVQVEFITADYGSQLNPQRAIVSARVTYARGAVTFAQAAATDLEPVPVFASVAWLHWPWGGIKEVVPSSPPVLPTLPTDFLYPFYMSDADNAAVAVTAAKGPVATALALTMATVLAVALFAVAG